MSHIQGGIPGEFSEKVSWESEQKVPSAKVGQLMTRQWLADPVSVLSS